MISRLLSHGSQTSGNRARSAATGRSKTGKYRLANEANPSAVDRTDVSHPHDDRGRRLRAHLHDPQERLSVVHGGGRSVLDVGRERDELVADPDSLLRPHIEKSDLRQAEQRPPVGDAQDSTRDADIGGDRAHRRRLRVRERPGSSTS